MTVTLRPTIPADIAQVTDDALPWRIRALTGEVDGRVIGVGGLAYLPGGTVAAWAALTDEARACKVSLHRAGLRFMADIKAAGIRRVVASADIHSPAALRWLLRLGFRPVDDDPERAVFVWTPDHVE